MFFILTASRNIKIHGTKFEVGCSYKECNQFLLLKNKQGVSYDLFPLIWNPLCLISLQATKSLLEEGQLKFHKISNKKGSVKKNKTSIKRRRVFKIALKDGGNRKFASECLAIQCFCHAKGNIQEALINQNQHDICAHKD